MCAKDIKLLIADAVKVRQHPNKDIPRECDLARIVLDVQDRLGDQVRLDREQVQPIDRLVIELGLAKGNERARGRLTVRRDLDPCALVVGSDDCVAN
jgi:hypothetical protein